jgi:hypothetical protein
VYNEIAMARGWESKEVESQIEAREAEKERQKQPMRTAEQMSRERKRDGLLLSRSRVLTDIAKCENPSYRALLQRSLSFLDEQIALLPPE